MNANQIKKTRQTKASKRNQAIGQLFKELDKYYRDCKEQIEELVPLKFNPACIEQIA